MAPSAPIHRSRITGIGFHVPPRVVTNADLEQVMDTTDAWIVERTGIRERRFVEPAGEDHGAGILSCVLHGEGGYAKDLWAEAPTSLVAGRMTPEMLEQGRHYPQMNGRQVFKHATTRFPEVILEALERAGHTL